MNNNEINNNMMDEDSIIDPAQEQVNQDFTNRGNKNEQCMSEHNPKVGTNNFKKWIEEPMTKIEALIMFAILAFILLFCNMYSQYLTANHRIDEMERLNILESKIDNLKDNMEIYYQTINNRPINITLNTNGEQQNITADPGTGDQLNEDFDTRPFLGVAFVEGNDGSGNPIGIKIDYVYEYSPAYFAGIKAGDIIMSIDGEKIDNYNDLANAIDKRKANETISIELATAGDNGVNVVTIGATLTYRGNFELEND